MSQPLLSFQDITFGYEPGSPPLLQDLNLSLEAGSVAAILGPNGAGKTTLLYLALGWLKPWGGSILVSGQPLPRYSRRQLGRHMALIPQFEHVPFDYTVLEYVLLGRAPHLSALAMPGDDDYAAAFQALERVGMSELHRHSLLELSGGERQLILVARSLAQQPGMLLLDEPTSHLDLGNKSRLLRILGELHAQGVTILMTTHEPEIAQAIATQVVLMEKGRVFTSGAASDVLTSPNLSRVYGIPVHVVDVDGRRQVLWT
jgi:iron complex transport system ATP-binding protein